MGFCSKGKTCLVLFWAEGRVLYQSLGVLNDWFLSLKKKAMDLQGAKFMFGLDLL